MIVVRRAGAPLLAALLAALLCVVSAGQAQATGYRYWSFWERTGGHWTYATQGPSTARPADGDVQGFRFAVSEDSASATRPRGTADFDAICAKVPAREGRKRIALVLDFGTAADAPSGETPPGRRTACAAVSGDGTTADALAAVAGPLRYDTNALLCAIDGYPRKGCGEQVAAGKPAEERAGSKPSHSTSDGPSVGLPVGVGAVVLLGAAAIWRARRRGRA
ncbi:SCO2322 family protein [Streptomyces sp. NPDC020298]|uniref:SCO2322 family protein n=1 Tax=unclassified Streptomyces TaxID=2593676 RepID=UPI0033D0D46A